MRVIERQAIAAFYTRQRCVFRLMQLSPFTSKSSAWRELMELPTIQDRVAHMQKAEVRDKLIKQGMEAGDLKQMAHMLHPFGHDERPDLDFDRKRPGSISGRNSRTPLRFTWTIDRL